jgi:acetoin utilization protein AcuB
MLTTIELMTIDPDIIAPDATLRQAIALMNARNIRQLLVVEDGRLVGIITDRDVRLAVNSPLITIEPLDKIELLDANIVASCMTTNPKTVTPETPIHRVAEILSAYKYGALPVVDKEQLVGIITVTDLLKQMALLPSSD